MNRLAVVVLGLFAVGCGADDSEKSKASAGTGGHATGGTTSSGGGTTSSGGGTTASGGGAPSGGGGTTTSGGGGSAASAPVDATECASPSADWVFCSDFQSNSKAEWDDYDGNPDETNLIVSDPGPFGIGSNLAMRFRVPPGRGGADLVKVLPEHDKLYARWYIKYEAGFDFSAPNHGGGLHAGNRDLLGSSDNQPSGSDWFTAWVDYLPDEKIFDIYSYYRGMYQDCVDPNGQCWGDHFPCVYDDGSNYCEKPQHRETAMPPTLTQDKWYCVEILMDGGTPTSSEAGANGVFDLWVDGQEFGPWNDLWLRTTADLKISILWLSLFHHEEHSVEGVMYDHVVVSKNRIGCL